MNGPLIVDTHILVWSILQPEALTEDIHKRIALAQENNELLISSMTLWEIAMLTFKRRINIYEPIKDFLESVVSIHGLSVKDLTPEIAAESILLADNFHGDPADRIIAATTKVYGATLITRDHDILAWAKLGHVKFLQA
jgi:PIN domain nuclease of toxin-antitoxin system